jgi:hypothetical protein
VWLPEDPFTSRDQGVLVDQPCEAIQPHMWGAGILIHHAATS